jgi:hypothetical protein
MEGTAILPAPGPLASRTHTTQTYVVATPSPPERLASWLGRFPEAVEHEAEAMRLRELAGPGRAACRSVTRRRCGADSNRQNRQNLNGFSATGNPRIDVEPHGGPATVPGDRRFWPNPAELALARERLPHDAGLRQTRPVVSSVTQQKLELWQSLPQFKAGPRNH